MSDEATTNPALRPGPNPRATEITSNPGSPATSDEAARLRELDKRLNEAYRRIEEGTSRIESALQRRGGRR